MKNCIGIILNEWEDYQRVAKQLFASEIREGTVLLVVAKFEDYEETTRKLVKNGAEAIIARGGIYVYLQDKIVDVPLVSMRMDANDIFIELECAAKDYRLIHLIISKYTNCDYEKYSNLLPEKIDFFRFNSPTEIDSYISGLEQRPDTVVVGSGFASAPAQKYGFAAKVIHSSDRSFLEAYAAAQQLLSEKEKVQEQAKNIETVLASMDAGVILANHEGRIIHINRRAKTFMGVAGCKVEGELLNTAIPKLATLVNEYRKKGRVVDRVIREKSTTLSAEIQPLNDSDASWLLVTLQDVTKIQETEKRLRFEMCQKGLTAKAHFSDILTKDKDMQSLIERAERYAKEDCTIMLYGESGTGKELFAQSIHNASPHSAYPFVAVNCAAITESLLESELFGYVGGSFTGAREKGKAGLFEIAHGGTLFLDEINSMSLSTQSKILRVIEQREVMRLGSDYVIPLDLHIICAANDDLLKMVESGTFRRDLFFRLNVLDLSIPPLNERPVDIVYLFRHFVAEFKGTTLNWAKLGRETEQALLNHTWRGNIRELRNAAQKHVLLEPEGVSIAQVLRETQHNQSGEVLVREDLHIDIKTLNQKVEDLIIDYLFESGLTKTQIAKAMGISRTALYKKMEK